MSLVTYSFHTVVGHSDCIKDKELQKYKLYY